ncbi:hypothetical protein L2K70_17060 [Nocardioides KLBMP 9356]|uniref:ABC transporter ATP-binding protein n=1 Tax=Nocardioides potassii TaxID=2911371 RepID=A0ABS9HGE6_9ACTN|nr:hypothetical protein [Nocardioides potassii]MCF6379324.1 hypothetical protein [Nocardioides potassii]
MSETVIEARGLRKEFRGRRGTHVAVDDLDLAACEVVVQDYVGGCMRTISLGAGATYLTVVLDGGRGGLAGVVPAS